MSTHICPQFSRLFWKLAMLSRSLMRSPFTLCFLRVIFAFISPHVQMSDCHELHVLCTVVLREHLPLREMQTQGPVPDTLNQKHWWGTQWVVLQSLPGEFDMCQFSAPVLYTVHLLKIDILFISCITLYPVACRGHENSKHGIKNKIG
jgi:hypothetical protein